jgi:pyruvate/2-oxoglutarate/acetoin dehydrogenase E1 component
MQAKLRFMSDQAGLLTSCIFDDDPCILIRRRSVHSHRVEGDVQRPRPEDLCAPVALGEAAIVRRGGDVTVIGRGRAIPDSLAGRSRALRIAQLNATFTKTQGVMLSFRAFIDNSFKMLMLIV